MAVIGELLVNLRADIASFRSSMEETKLSLVQIGIAASESKAEIASLTGIMSEAKVAVEGYLAAFAVREITDFVEKQAEAVAQIGESAKVIGIGVEAYQGLAFAAKQVGVEHEALDKGLSLFTKNIGLASLGSEKAGKGFKQLGIDLRDGAGNVKSTEALFEEAATKLSDLTNVEQRNAIASELFGKGFAGIANLLAIGGAGIDEFRRKAEELGVILSHDDVEAGTKAAEQFRTLSQVISTDLERSVIAIGPQLVAMATFVTGLATSVAAFFKSLKPPEDLAGSTPQLTERLKLLNREIVDGENGLKRWKDTWLGWTHDSATAGFQKQIDEWKKEKLEVLELMAQDRRVPAMSIIGPEKPDLPEPISKERQKEIANYQRSRDELTASERLGLDAQIALHAAYQQGTQAVDAARVANAGAAAVLKLENEALRDHVTVTMNDRMEVGLLAEWKERATLATEHQKAATDAMNSAWKSEYDALLKLGEPTGDLTKKQQELADSIGKVWEAYNLGIIKTLPEAQAQIEELHRAVDASSKGTREIVSAVERGASGFLDSITKIGQSKDPLLAVGQAFLSLAQDIEKAIVQALVLQPILQSLGIENGKLGSSGVIPDLLSWLHGTGGGASTGTQVDAGTWSVPPQAQGGSFDVGGVGGTDSQIVGFKATPGEHVSIGQPGQTSGGDMHVVINNNHSGAEVSAQQVPDGRGGKSLIVQIDEALAYGVGTGKSQMATALQQSGIGNPRTPVAR